MAADRQLKQIIETAFQTSIAVKQQTLAENSETIADIITCVDSALANGGKLLICGNGGSAADAQHIAAEFVCRFRLNRQALPAIALTTDTSILTATANDFDFDQIFARQVAALGKPGDVLLGISTSGNSANICEAAKTARAGGLQVIGFTGADGGDLQAYCHLCLCVPSTITAHIQEVHITAAHVLCQVVEERLFRS